MGADSSLSPAGGGNVKEKYRILRTMAVVYKVMAWVSLIFGLIASITFLIQFSLISQQLGTAMPAIAGFSVFLVLLVYTLLAFGTFYAVAELINLLFDIEHQSRATKDRVTEMRPAA